MNEEEVQSWSPLLVVQFFVGMDFQESELNYKSYVWQYSNIALTSCIPIASCERNVSLFKITTMSQLRLNGKAMLFIKNQLANKLNFY